MVLIGGTVTVVLLIAPSVELPEFKSTFVWF